MAKKKGNAKRAARAANKGAKKGGGKKAAKKGKGGVGSRGEHF